MGTVAGLAPLMKFRARKKQVWGDGWMRFAASFKAETIRAIV
jgi:hypothetical protein